MSDAPSLPSAASEPASPPVLVADRLVFSHPRRHVFNGWSAGFGKGLTWLRGANGSGKSTLLHLLAGALSPQAGTLAVLGIDARVDPVAYRREVFLCGAGAIAFDHLRPSEFFAFMRGLYPRFDTASARSHAHAFGLEPHLDLRLASLSTGSQRKVWIAAALAAGSAVVLMDEPTHALDAASLAYLRQALQHRAEARGQAWIVTSHEPLGAAADHAAVVDLASPTA